MQGMVCPLLPLGQLAPGQELGSPQAQVLYPTHLQQQQVYTPTGASTSFIPATFTDPGDHTGCLTEFLDDPLPSTPLWCLMENV